MARLGLIAGGGDLPVEIASGCRAGGQEPFVVRIRGLAAPALDQFDGVDAGLGEFGKGAAALKRAGCDRVCFAGIVKRPDFSALKMDLKGLAALPGLLNAAREGDDALMRQVLATFEAEGFAIVGADEVMADLTLPLGALGAHAPAAAGLADARKALHTARAVGALDVGQGAVVCDGLVLAVEAQEGTDEMLRRTASLPATLRGAPGHRRGVLAKAPKPIQERRVDLPVIGPGTVELAAAAGLAGIAGEAGGLLVVDRPAVIAAADRLGLFVWGEPPARQPDPAP